MIAETGRFLTFCGGAPTIGYRMREDPADRAALKIVRETDAGIVVNGKIGMHTSPAYAEDVYVGSISGLEDRRALRDLHRPGRSARRDHAVPQDRGARSRTRSSRRSAAASTNSTARCGSTTCSSHGSRSFCLGQSPEPVVRWLIWHHVYGWLSKAEFTLGLALALSHAMGLAQHEQTIDYLVDLIVEVQTVRSCLTACERDPRFTPDGWCVPNHAHLAAGGLAILRARPRMAEILRIVPGSSLVVAPSDSDLAAPEIAEGLDEFVRRRRLHAHCSAQPCCRWPGTMSHRRSTGANRRSNCTPAAAFRPGAAGCATISRATTTSPIASPRSLGIPMPEIDLDHIREVPVGAPPPGHAAAAAASKV